MITSEQNGACRSVANLVVHGCCCPCDHHRCGMLNLHLMQKDVTILRDLNLTCRSKGYFKDQSDNLMSSCIHIFNKR